MLEGIFKFYHDGDSLFITPEKWLLPLTQILHYYNSIILYMKAYLLLLLTLLPLLHANGVNPFEQAEEHPAPAEGHALIQEEGHDKVE